MTILSKGIDAQAEPMSDLPESLYKAEAANFMPQFDQANDETVEAFHISETEKPEENSQESISIKQQTRNFNRRSVEYQPSQSLTSTYAGFKTSLSQMFQQPLDTVKNRKMFHSRSAKSIWNVDP
jgi:hypothetical protein